MALWRQVAHFLQRILSGLETFAEKIAALRGHKQARGVVALRVLV